jgi:hypothetical protein
MDGRDPLSPDEYVLRRITAYKFDEKSKFPIPPEHFHPRPQDEDGISFYQEKVATPEGLADYSNKHGWIIAKIRVSELREIGLTAAPTGPNGHVSLRELSYANSKSSPDATDILKAKLASLAAKRIVLRTEPKPPE